MQRWKGAVVSEVGASRAGGACIVPPCVEVLAPGTRRAVGRATWNSNAANGRLDSGKGAKRTLQAVRGVVVVLEASSLVLPGVSSAVRRPESAPRKGVVGPWPAVFTFQLSWDGGNLSRWAHFTHGLATPHGMVGAGDAREGGGGRRERGGERRRDSSGRARG